MFSFGGSTVAGKKLRRAAGSLFEPTTRRSP
jgi:hypothetical protein